MEWGISLSLSVMWSRSCDHTLTEARAQSSTSENGRTPESPNTTGIQPCACVSEGGYEERRRKEGGAEEGVKRRRRRRSERKVAGGGEGEGDEGEKGKERGKRRKNRRGV